jgi:membrane protease YdiL (CAAX protease family)
MPNTFDRPKACVEADNIAGYVAIPIVAAAGAALLGLGRWVTRRSGAQLGRNPAVAHHLVYQPLSVGIAFATIIAVRILVPGSSSYFQAGDLLTPVAGLTWMGVPQGDTWFSLGLSLGIVVTAITMAVVWLQAAKAGSVDARRLPSAILFALPFALVNSAVEEVIFRLALCNALGTVAPMMTVALLSGVLFGIPHYFGNPGKVPGVLLAGFLGWLMCLSVLQTGGMGWAWAIHFVQDVVIFALLFAVAATGVARQASGESVNDAA